MTNKLIAVMSIILLSMTASAADAPAWGGAWSLSDGKKGDAAREKAIEDATADMGAFKRRTARSRLGDMLAPPKQLTLKLNGSEVEITRNGKTMKIPADGSSKTVQSDNGSATASAENKGDRLVVKVDGERGKRQTIYERKGSTLMMTVVLNAKLLSKPLRVSSIYTASK
ncbi:MAG: hypothetical protein AAFU77_02510 [Myxococcota bacterium]